MAASSVLQQRTRRPRAAAFRYRRSLRPAIAFAIAPASDLRAPWRRRGPVHGSERPGSPTVASCPAGRPHEGEIRAFSRFDATGAGGRVRGYAAAGRARRRSPATATGRCLAVTLTRSVSAPLVAQWSSRALCAIVSYGHRTATASPTIATVISARLSSSWILRSIAACSPAKASRTSHSYQSAHAAAATARSFRARWRTR